MEDSLSPLAFVVNILFTIFTLLLLLMTVFVLGNVLLVGDTRLFSIGDINERIFFCGYGDGDDKLSNDTCESSN